MPWIIVTYDDTALSCFVMLWSYNQHSIDFYDIFSRFSHWVARQSYDWYNWSNVSKVTLKMGKNGAVTNNKTRIALLWCHNGRDGVSNHQPHQCLLNRLFRRRSKKTSKLRVTSLCAGNSPGTGKFPAQMASNAENVSIWWRHHGIHDSWCMARVYVIPQGATVPHLTIHCQ